MPPHTLRLASIPAFRRALEEAGGPNVEILIASFVSETQRAAFIAHAISKGDLRVAAEYDNERVLSFDAGWTALRAARVAPTRGVSRHSSALVDAGGAAVGTRVLVLESVLGVGGTAGVGASDAHANLLVSFDDDSRRFTYLFEPFLVAETPRLATLTPSAVGSRLLKWTAGQKIFYQSGGGEPSEARCRDQCCAFVKAIANKGRAAFDGYVLLKR
jgi:hypothetical protein